MSLGDQDRRQYRRVTFTIRAPLAGGSGSDNLIEDSSTIDISESGVRLRSRRLIVPGQIVDVFLDKRPERCRVVWTNPADVSHELIAELEFIRPLPDPIRS
jgi:hypothetical protein